MLPALLGRSKSSSPSDTTATDANATTTTTQSPIAGVEAFAVTGRNHVTTPVSYPQSPPVGGDHLPVWLSCGFYDQPILTETGVN